MDDKDKQIAELKKELETKDSEIHGLSVTIKQRWDGIRDIEKQLAEANERVKELEGECLNCANINQYEIVERNKVLEAKLARIVEVLEKRKNECGDWMEDDAHKQCDKAIDQALSKLRGE